MTTFQKDKQYFKFCAYGFLKNLRFHDAFLLLFFLENGVSFAQIGILYASREIIINILEVPSGIIADTYGRKSSLIAAFFLYILSFLIFYISTNFSLLLLAISLSGIGDAFRSGTHKGMIMDYLKIKGWEDQKINYYGHTRSWSQKGSAVSALFAGILVLYSGSYRIIYLCSVVPYLLNFVNIFTYPQALNFSLKTKKKRKPRSFNLVLKDFIQAIRNRKVFQIINSAALHSSYLKSIKDYIQLVMLQVAILFPILSGFDIKRKSGLIIGFLYFLIFLLTSQASKASFMISKMRVRNITRLTLLTGLAAGLVSGLFLNFQLWIPALLSFIIIYLIENARKPILTGILSNNVPNEVLTSVISAQSFYSTIITSMLAILFGFVADQLGIGISLSIISACLILFILLLGNSKLKSPIRALKPSQD